MARPMRSASLIANQLRNEGKLNTVEGIMMLCERLGMILNEKNYDETLQSNISNLCQHLKSYGCHLDSLYKEQLDQVFIIFRNACQDIDLDYMSRIHLLQIIELRANQWNNTEHMQNYYATHTLQQDRQQVFTSPSHNIEPILMSSPVLSVGEVVKSSGKFLKPTRLPGKNYFKDEVVIRNADSGKVMGIKGRRVHMIEELSETIISFQHVSPGAKERLVQMTGSSEEALLYARQLIEETIRRNASPVRIVPPCTQNLSTPGNLMKAKGSTSSLSSSEYDEDENMRMNKTSGGQMNKSNYATGDNGPQFKYTVTVNDKSLKITGSDLEFVRTAKLVLDEYFGGILSDTERFISANDLWTNPWDDNTIRSKNHYDQMALLELSKLAQSREPPINWDKIKEAFPNVVLKSIRIFDVDKYLMGKKQDSGNEEQDEIITVSDDDEDDDDCNNNENDNETSKAENKIKN